MNLEILIEAYHKSIVEGGATFNQKGIPTFKSGYLVSLSGYESKIPLATFGLKDLENYVNLHKDKVEAIDNAYVGVWLDEETKEICLDVSLHIGDRESAIRLGISNKQKAIYDVVQDDIIVMPPQQGGGTDWQKEIYTNRKVRELL